MGLRDRLKHLAEEYKKMTEIEKMVAVYRLRYVNSSFEDVIDMHTPEEYEHILKMEHYSLNMKKIMPKVKREVCNS